MKKKELIEIIRFAVRKELKECLPAIIKECAGHTPKKKSTRETDPVELAKQVLRTETKVASAPKIQTKQYTKNELLNEAMNATVGGIPQPGSRVVSDTTEGGVTDFNGNEVSVDELPPELAGALTRDYSELMTAINDKRGPTK